MAESLFGDPCLVVSPPRGKLQGCTTVGQLTAEWRGLAWWKRALLHSVWSRYGGHGQQHPANPVAAAYPSWLHGSFTPPPQQLLFARASTLQWMLLQQQQQQHFVHNNNIIAQQYKCTTTSSVHNTAFPRQITMSSKGGLC